jgi:hypothetical protein
MAYADAVAAALVAHGEENVVSQKRGHRLLRILFKLSAVAAAACRATAPSQISHTVITCHNFQFLLPPDIAKTFAE